MAIPKNLKKTFSVTFYSFKGGVGRTLALANVARSLAMDGYKVAVVDLDLEAPGIDILPGFERESQITKKEKQESKELGIVDLLIEYKKKEKNKTGKSDLKLTKNYYYEKKRDKEKEMILVIPAGERDVDSYIKKLGTINWGELYDGGTDSIGFKFMEQFKKEIENLGVDYIFFDSRTGWSDIAGIANHQLADLIILVFSLNEQNIKGISNFYQQIIKTPKRTKMVLVVSPVPPEEWNFGGEVQKKLEEASSEMPEAINSGSDSIIKIPFYEELVFKQSILMDKSPKPPICTKYKNIREIIQETSNIDGPFKLEKIKSKKSFPDMKKEYIGLQEEFSENEELSEKILYAMTECCIDNDGDEETIECLRKIRKLDTKTSRAKELELKKRLRERMFTRINTIETELNDRRETFYKTEEKLLDLKAKYPDIKEIRVALAQLYVKIGEPIKIIEAEKLIKGLDIDNEKLDLVRNEIRKYKEDESRRSKKARTLKAPGDLIPLDSPNYIKRECDQGLKRFMKSGYPFWINIIGPPQSGKSSLLGNVKEFAKEQNIEILEIDFRKMYRNIDPELRSYSNLLKEFFKSLKGIGSNANNIKTTEPLSSSRFEELLEYMLKNRTKIILLLDSIDFLLKYLIKEEMDKFLNLLEGWTELKSQKEIFKKLSVVTAVTPASVQMDANTESTFMSKGYKINLESFSKIDIREFSARFGIENDSIIGSAEQLFGGQPYLTHLFFSRLYSGQTEKKVKRDALADTGDFYKYWERIKFEIMKYPMPESEKERWRQLQKFAQDQGDRVEFTQRFKECMSELHLIDSLNNQICGEFYRNAILLETTT